MTRTPTAGQLWIALARCHKALSVLVEDSVNDDGLCLTDFMILEALSHKGPLTITEVQNTVLLASGSMTIAVDRLVNKGLIVRKATEIDRRARRLELTPKGRGLISQVLPHHLAELEDWMSVLNAAERRNTYQALRKLGLHAVALRTERPPAPAEKESKP